MKKFFDKLFWILVLSTILLQAFIIYSMPKKQKQYDLVEVKRESVYYAYRCKVSGWFGETVYVSNNYIETNYVCQKFREAALK